MGEYNLMQIQTTTFMVNGLTFLSNFALQRLSVSPNHQLMAVAAQEKLSVQYLAQVHPDMQPGGIKRELRSI